MNLKGSRANGAAADWGKPLFSCGGADVICEWYMRVLKEALRKRLRHHRQNITAKERSDAEQEIAQHLFQSSLFKQAQKMAIYLPFDGEVPTHIILQTALLRQKAVYAPVVASNSLKFVKISLDTPLRANRFGIVEPHYPLMKQIPPAQFDIVIVPMVGFDHHCHRLGMGGGFYDKTFAFKKRTLKPKLIGLAYDFQRVSRIPTSGLDLLLDEVITEKRRYRPLSI